MARGSAIPRAVEWAPSQSDARHVVVMTGGMRDEKLGVVTLFARAQSGLAVHAGGAGRRERRRPRRRSRVHPESGARERIAALAASACSSLLDGGFAERANAVSQAYLGQVAERNGCRGPWTQSLNVQWRPPMPRRWGGRVTPAVYLQNVLAGVDQLVHGNGGLRGWGSPATPDPVLFVPRGFDATAQRFRYDVNPRFADTRPSRTLLPRAVPDRDRLLAPTLDRLRAPAASPRCRAGEERQTGWQRRSADSHRRVLPAEHARACTRR